MIKEEVEKALNKQLNAEYYSSYLYLSMSAYFQSTDLPGFANWMKAQADEEYMHAMKFYNYISERGSRVNLQSIEGPEIEWESPKAVFEHVYQHEQKVTGLINDLVELALKARDHATNNFLQWFIDEQVEEEASASEALNKVKLVGNDGSGLLILDQELGKRVFTPPAAEQK